MENLISIKNLIKEIKQRRIDLGKGDPYNRLRYYTKIGWLPHMIRKTNKKGDIEGHYPTWVIDTLLYIEDLKKTNLSNEEITEKIKAKNTIRKITDVLQIKESKRGIIMYLIIIILSFIILTETDIIKLNKSKETNLSLDGSLDTQIIDSGTAFFPYGKIKILIKSTNITSTSKVYVTFKQDYSPANRFWVSELKPQEGFVLELDAPVANNTEFSWWISN